MADNSKATVNYLHFPGEQKPDTPEDEYISMAKVSKMTGLPHQTIYSEMRAGNMDSIKIRRFGVNTYTFRYSDVLDYCIAHEISDEDKHHV